MTRKKTSDKQAPCRPRTGTSTNYPIDHYPNLSDRVLTEVGLALTQQGM